MDTESNGDGVVQIAYLHPEHVSHSWFDSMRRMWDHDRDHGGRIAPKPLNIRCTSVSIMTARNFATRLFLNRTDHEWFMFIDTDMGFGDDAVHRLLEVADPIERPIVGGLCFAHMEAEYDHIGGYRFTVTPTMYRIGTTTKGAARFCFYGDYPENEVVRVAATGAAFLLIHRSVLVRMQAEFGERWWDQFVDEDGDMVGEDMAFCARALKMNIPVHVHTGVKTSHHKYVWLQEEDYLRQAVIQGSLVTVAQSNVDVSPKLKPAVDIGASLATLARNEHDHDGMLKLPEDLERYKAIIEATKPDVIIETGTWNGVSARWFAEQGCDVISIDIDSPLTSKGDRIQMTDGTRPRHRINFWRGDSTNATMLERIKRELSTYDNPRVMVVLDSDHSSTHVAAEIAAYGPMVTPGCYLVVEDGLLDFAPAELLQQHYPNGDAPERGPTYAIEAELADNGAFSRDLAIEGMSPVSHSPAGWWIRNG